MLNICVIYVFLPPFVSSAKMAERIEARSQSQAGSDAAAAAATAAATATGVVPPPTADLLSAQPDSDIVF